MELTIKYAWLNPHGGKWIIYNKTNGLQIAICSVSENPHSLARPYDGIAIMWVQPSITHEQALQHALESPIYLSLCKTEVVKHSRTEQPVNSESKKIKVDAVVTQQIDIDSSKKRRHE
jgi:hypothetical protein